MRKLPAAQDRDDGNSNDHGAERQSGAPASRKSDRRCRHDFDAPGHATPPTRVSPPGKVILRGARTDRIEQPCADQRDNEQPDSDTVQYSSTPSRFGGDGQAGVQGWAAAAA